MATPPPAWHPDPSGRHETRYWDGSAWTDHVADTGIPAQDPPGWPAAGATAGVGLRSARLRFLHPPSADAWPVLDGSGMQAGWVTTGQFGLGSRSVQVWDTENDPWLAVKASTKGSQVLVNEAEVARISWHGWGSLSSVSISVDLGGRSRAGLTAQATDLRTGAARVTDPSGFPLIAVRIDREDGPVITTDRLVDFPEWMEFAVLAIAPALMLELDRRASFRVGNRDSGDAWRTGSGLWPGL